MKLLNTLSVARAYSIFKGLQIKDACEAAAVSNITMLSGIGTVIDGYVVAENDRILLTAQSSGISNGIWEAHSGVWTRPADFAVGMGVYNSSTIINNGTLYAGSTWVCTTGRPGDIVGTNALTFEQFSLGGVATAGDGLKKVGNEISVELSPTNPGLELVGTSPNKKLEAQVVPPGPGVGGIEKTSNGLQLKLNGSTLQLGAGGASVKGVPNLFEVGGNPTSQTLGVGQVTSGNLNKLTAGPYSNADALHMHAGTGFDPEDIIIDNDGRIVYSKEGFTLTRVP